MRSRAERLLGFLGIAAIVLWTVNALVPRVSQPPAETVSDLPAQLPRWTRAHAPRAVHVRLDTIPDAATAHWLAAMSRAGTAVSWDGSVPALALEVFRSAAPAGDLVILAATPDGPGVLRDGLGAVDTLRAGAASVRLASVHDGVTLQAGESRVRASEPAPRDDAGGSSKSVFVAGLASWEVKFVIDALEADGWRVDARLFVAPGIDVVQGRGRASLDTGRHAAVVLMDSAGAETVRGVESFVRRGGGVVLAGTANQSRRVASLAGWRAGAREVAPLGTPAGDTAWRGLSREPLTLASPGSAIALETRDGKATMAARRHHGGRVVGVGYDETWRWRMAGGANSVAEHRAWWTRIVASVAARPARVDMHTTGGAPAAALVATLGPPSPAPAPGRGLPRDAIARLLGLIAFGALLAEWLLRRARGAR